MDQLKVPAFFVFPLDYAGLFPVGHSGADDPSYPRAHYQHLMIAHRFNWDTRRGEYIHIPYGGRIEIEAI